MSRFITISLDKRGVSCVAELDEVAPRTCAAVWDALPLSASVFRGKYARNEIYTLLPAFAPADPGKENTTVTPIPGDLFWLSFDSDDLGNPAYGYENTTGTGTQGAIVDLAVFYGRNNLLINADLAGCRATSSVRLSTTWTVWRAPARTSGWAKPAAKPSASAAATESVSRRDSVSRGGYGLRRLSPCTRRD